MDAVIIITWTDTRIFCRFFVYLSPNQSRWTSSLSSLSSLEKKLENKIIIRALLIFQMIFPFVTSSTTFTLFNVVDVVVENMKRIQIDKSSYLQTRDTNKQTLLISTIYSNDIFISLIIINKKIESKCKNKQQQRCSGFFSLFFNESYDNIKCLNLCLLFCFLLCFFFIILCYLRLCYWLSSSSSSLSLL